MLPRERRSGVEVRRTPDGGRRLHLSALWAWSRIYLPIQTVMKAHGELRANELKGRGSEARSADRKR